MVSAQVAGLIRMYQQKPNGNKFRVAQYRVEDSAPAGGASEGAGSAVATPEKRIGIDSPLILVNDDILLVTFEPDAGATLDATDMVWSIPTVTVGGGSAVLGRAQFANPAVTDQVLSASLEVEIAGYKVTEGAIKISGRIYHDFQNNA